MYKEFFNLHSNPFQLSPDPSFMVSSDRSKEALTAISSAVGQRKGFVVMTGEVGTGKTLVLRCLFELWEREQIPFAYFIGPRLSTVDFLSYINYELGIRVGEPTKGNLLRALYGFFLTQFEKGLTTVLIIDEAHEMPRSVLEEVRLLTNFETAQQKLVQIVLVGQPELDKKLDSVELRSLKQRIAVRCRLEPLRAEEVRSYIERRLEIAGADRESVGSIFPVDTVKTIYRYSAGLPRLVNNICDQALMAACSSQVRIVPPEMIEEIALRFRLEPLRNSRSPDALFTPVSQGQRFDVETERPLPPMVSPPHTAPAVPAAPSGSSAKTPNADTVLLYLDLEQNAAAQGAGASQGDVARKSVVPEEVSALRETGDSAPETISHNAFRNALNEMSLRSWSVKEAQRAGELPAAGATVASVTAASERQSDEELATAMDASPSLDAEIPVVESFPLEPAKRLPPHRVETQNVCIAPPKTEVSVEPERAIAPRSSSQHEDRQMRVLAAFPESASRSKEAEPYRQPSHVALQAKEAWEKNKQSILAGAAAAALFALSAGGAVYLRRASKVSVVSPAALAAKVETQPVAGAMRPEAQPGSGSAMTSGSSIGASTTPGVSAKPPANLDLENKSVSPTPVAGTKTTLGHLQLAKPRVAAGGKPVEVREPGATLMSDARTVSSNDGLSAGLIAAGSRPGFPLPPQTGGNVKTAKMISSVSPVYPALAKNQHVSGDVRIDALIDAEGRVSEMEVESGPVLLRDAATQALRQWRYQPATLDGRPVPMHVAVTIQFRME